MRRLLLLLPALLVLTGCYSLNPNDHTHPGQVALGGDGYTVTAEFADMQNVVPNSTVQRDNVVIGTVTHIRVHDWTARVTMRLLRSVRLPANPVFRIGQKTLLGAQYVEVEDPAAPHGVLRDGASVPVEATGTYPETEQVLAGVSLLLNNGGLSQISTITGELNKALAGRVPDTRTLVTRLNQLLATLDSHRSDLVHLIDLADSLSAKVAGQSARVQQAVRSIAPGLTTLAAQRDQLVRAVGDLGRLSHSAESVVSTSQAALLANLRQLRPVLAALAASGSDVTNSLKLLTTVPFPVLTTTNAIRGDYMNMFATIDLSVPSLTAAFVGRALSAPAFEATDPVAGPLSGPPTTLVPGPVHGPATSPPATVPGPAAPSAAPTAGSAPQGTHCSLLSALLGGC